jgi:dienelactone hydrolase
MAVAICFVGNAMAAVVGESVVVGAGSGLELPGRYFRPAGVGPFPGVVVLHGSGGLWKDNNPTNGVMSKHFEEWAQIFAGEGYSALFIDSYSPRGIVEFPGRRPAEDPAVDDAKCSPAYERPKDVFKALRYLQARPEIMPDRIGLLGFSQGAETALASLLSGSVTKSDWSMTYLKANGDTEARAFPAPPRLDSAPGFNVACVFYPGCGFYGYFGSPSSEAANLYMPYAPTLILHGGADPLYAANFYPARMAGKSGAQAAAFNLGFNPLSLIVYPAALHSFDEADPAAEGQAETPSQAAKRLGRAEALRWFATYLQPLSVRVERAGDAVELTWPAAMGARQRILGGNSVTNLNAVLAEATDQGGATNSVLLPASGVAKFMRLETSLAAPF